MRTVSNASECRHRHDRRLKYVRFWCVLQPLWNPWPIELSYSQAILQRPDGLLKSAFKGSVKWETRGVREIEDVRWWFRNRGDRCSCFSNDAVLHWMSFSRMVRAPDYQCHSRNSRSQGSIPASSDTVEFEGRQKTMLNKVHKNIPLLRLLSSFIQSISVSNW